MMKLVLSCLALIFLVRVNGEICGGLEDGLYPTAEDENTYILFFSWKITRGAIPLYFIIHCDPSYNSDSLNLPTGVNPLTTDFLTPECPAIETKVGECPDVQTTTPKPTTTPTPTTKRTTTKEPTTTYIPPTPLPDDIDFLPFKCTQRGYFGFCEKAAYCRPTPRGFDLIWADCPKGMFFDDRYGSCVNDVSIFQFIKIVNEIVFQGAVLRQKVLKF